MAHAIELARELDGVVDGELGAGADGEMRGVRRVAHQHDMARAVEMAPALADQAIEIEPGRAAQVARIGHQRRAVEDLGEQLLAEGDELAWSSWSSPCASNVSSVVSTMKVEVVVVELVDMRLEPAVLGAAEIEGEGVEELVRAEPDVAVRAHHMSGLKTSA